LFLTIPDIIQGISRIYGYTDIKIIGNDTDFMNIYRLGDLVRVALSEKADGNMRAVIRDERDRVEENRKTLLAQLGLKFSNTYLVRVSYDTDDYCQFLTAGKRNALSLNEDAQRCDGLLTCEQGKSILLPLADCLGVVLYDTQNEAMMVAHCGTHTTLQDGAFHAVKYLMQAVGTIPENLMVWLSPSVGKESYPVYALDGISLQEAVVGQLAEAGVRESNIRQSNIDTATDERYFSHSQGDRLERFAIVGVID
jgi:copper oxidase (laccase) domain-containing protein